MSNAQTPRRRGRPKSPSKRLAIIEAARDLFINHGVDGVSLDVVIKTAAVSKTTFYSHFSNRAELFEAIVTREAENLLAAIDSWASSEKQELEADLIRFGEGMLSVLVKLDSIGIERMLGVRTQQRKALAEMFYSAGPARTTALLCDRLEAAKAAGDIDCSNVKTAADDFLALT